MLNFDARSRGEEEEEEEMEMERKEGASWQREKMHAWVWA